MPDGLGELEVVVGREESAGGGECRVVEDLGGDGIECAAGTAKGGGGCEVM